MDKTVHIKLRGCDRDLPLEELMKKIESLREEYPDLDFFFDGDEYAICSRPKKK